nr:immunoglobulin heavy chain junction region [Macaca mulatta]
CVGQLVRPYRFDVW